MLKLVEGITGASGPHWVGEGFSVRTLFSYRDGGAELRPFLLLDYAAPTRFWPTDQYRGAGLHPHRGVETVTIVYQGEVEHRDSIGTGGMMGPGDVLWASAASGIVHDEYHSVAFSRCGGFLEVVQLWVNLPARNKMGKPGYQTLRDAQIPCVPLPGARGRVRVVAGQCLGTDGPAITHTHINVWDVWLEPSDRARFTLPVGHTAVLVVLRGAVHANGRLLHELQMLRLGRDGDEWTVEAESDAVLLFLGGEPIDEPIVGRGTIIMNTQAEINEAYEDLDSGRFDARRT